jgi:hypothetical protein
VTGIRHPRIGLGILMLVLAFPTLVAWGCGAAPARTTVVTTASATSTSPSTTATDPSSTATTQPDTAAVTAAGVTLEYPAGWSSRVKGSAGLVLAERREDLIADTPGGARLLLEPIAGAPLDMVGVLEDVVESSGPAAAASVVVVEDPAQIKVGTEEAVSIALRDESAEPQTVTRYVLVELDAKTGFLFVLEAPADQWESKVAALEAILQSARFSTP